MMQDGPGPADCDPDCDPDLARSDNARSQGLGGDEFGQFVEEEHAVGGKRQ